VGVRDALQRALHRRSGMNLRPYAVSLLPAAMRSMWLDRTELRRLARSQGALRRVATLVARGIPPSEVFKTVAAELGSLVGADCTAIHRYESDETVTVVAFWSNPCPPDVIPPPRERWPTGVDTAAAIVLRTGAPTRILSSSVSDEIGVWARSHGLRHVVACPVWVEGRLWGDVAAMFRGDAPPPANMEERVGDFVELVACTIAQAKSRADLIDSRARVIAASDTTRRRIERDLHDGVQQHLIAIKYELRAAESMIPSERSELRQRLSSTSEGLSSVLSEVQEICRGLHPAVLARAGLKAALQALARRSPLPVELHADLNGDLPEQVEATLYYIACEALTNVVKHADASHIWVDVGSDDHEVRLSVRDDGLGGAHLGHGSGLIGVRDRIEAAEGTLRLTSPTRHF
jgi:signal transduction histidine kinase